MFRTLTSTSSNSVSVTEEIKDVGPCGEAEVRWVDLTHQDEETLAVLADRFGFHPLTIEDCLHFDQRPKLESYDGYAFLVVQGFRIVWEKAEHSDALELHIFIGKNFVVTVHDQQIPSLDSVWNRVQRDARLANHGADHLSYLIVDALIDSYFPVLDDLELRLDKLEDRVLDKYLDVQLSEILDFKRILIELRKILSPQRDVLALLAKRGEEHFSERVSVYFRDCYDHALRLHESVESARELVGNVRDAYLWNASQRTNEIMKQLTILSAVFLPLAFITGFFGQNFADMPYQNNVLMFAMLASCICVPMGMLFYFFRRRWF